SGLFDGEDKTFRNVIVRQQRWGIKPFKIKAPPGRPPFEATVVERNPLLDSDLLLPATLGSSICDIGIGQVVCDLSFADSPISQGFRYTGIVVLFGGHRRGNAPLCGLCQQELNFGIVEDQSFEVRGMEKIANMGALG